jgi:hypothetical protein
MYALHALTRDSGQADGRMITQRVMHQPRCNL